jgi:hypothetical protein
MDAASCGLCGRDLRSIYSLIHAAELAAGPPAPQALLGLDLNTQHTRQALYCFLGLCPGNVPMPTSDSEAAVAIYDAVTGVVLRVAGPGPQRPCRLCGRDRLSLYELIRRYYDDLPRAEFAKSRTAAAEALRDVAKRNASSLRCHVGCCGDAPLPLLTDVPHLLARPVTD